MRRSVMCALVTSGVVAAAAAGSAATSPSPLTVSNLFTKQGKPAPLRSGAVYQANQSFPTGLRLTIPGGRWAGAQWRSGKGPGPAGQKKPPFYGWVGLLAGPPSKAPLGAMFVMTAWAATPPVATLVDSLRSRGSGAKYGGTSPVSVAGYTGTQFEATITGREHAFIPFSKVTGASQYYGDAVFFGKGERVHVIVLNVRGKSTLVFMESARLSLAKFPAFVARVTAILGTVKFSK